MSKVELLSSPCIVIVAGEASGELLAIELIQQLNKVYSNIRIYGVGGEAMAACNVTMIRDNEAFQVMGLAEIIKDLPSLLKAKNQLVEDIKEISPDLFIGVDAPELNFAIAKKLQQSRIPILHYVSPSVWAWRPGRIDKMDRFIDYLLTLFPFEPALYARTAIQTHFVGHPLARKIPVEVNKISAKSNLGLSSDSLLMAILPGSRDREIETLMPVFAETIQQLKLKDWQFVSSSVSAAKQQHVEQIAGQYGLNLIWVDDATEALKAADFALLGSGTVALEAMLCKTPMVVAYRIAALTYFIVKRFKMMQLPYYSLPNVLYGDFLVPEVMQKNLTPEQLAITLKQSLGNDNRAQLLHRFTQLHRQLLVTDDQLPGKVVANILDSLC